MNTKLLCFLNNGKCLTDIFLIGITIFLLTACKSNTFIVPEIGTRFDQPQGKDKFIYDELTKERIIPLEQYKIISYGSFEIERPLNVSYYAPISSNAQNTATWKVRLPKNSNSSCTLHAMYTKLPLECTNLKDLEHAYKAKFIKKTDIIDCQTKMGVRDEHQILQYTITAREAETGRFIVSDGFILLDQNHPEYFYEVSAERRAYERDINQEVLIESIRAFMDGFSTTTRK